MKWLDMVAKNAIVDIGEEKVEEAAIGPIENVRKELMMMVNLSNDKYIYYFWCAFIFLTVKILKKV